MGADSFVDESPCNFNCGEKHQNSAAMVSHRELAFLQVTLGPKFTLLRCLHGQACVGSKSLRTQLACMFPWTIGLEHSVISHQISFPLLWSQ